MNKECISSGYREYISWMNKECISSGYREYISWMNKANVFPVDIENIFHG